MLVVLHLHANRRAAGLNYALAVSRLGIHLPARWRSALEGVVLETHLLNVAEGIWGLQTVISHLVLEEWAAALPVAAVVCAAEQEALLLSVV